PLARPSFRPSFLPGNCTGYGDFFLPNPVENTLVGVKQPFTLLPEVALGLARYAVRVLPHQTVEVGARLGLRLVVSRPVRAKIERLRNQLMNNLFSGHGVLVGARYCSCVALRLSQASNPPTCSMRGAFGLRIRRRCKRRERRACGRSHD